MATTADIDAYLIRANVEYDELSEGTWVVHDQEGKLSDVVVRAEDPIVVFRMKVMTLPNKATEPFLRRLLELNAREMLHASFGLEGDIVVVGGALALENLDYNEFQAMLDDLSIAVTEHAGALRNIAGSQAG